jgi:hypothetical protein
MRESLGTLAKELITAKQAVQRTEQVCHPPVGCDVVSEHLTVLVACAAGDANSAQ